MIDAAEQYKARLAAYAEGKDPIAMQREAPALYARLSSVRASGMDELVLQFSDLPVRAMTNVTLARLGDIVPVERDLSRRELRASELDLRYRDQVIARLP